MCVQVFTIEVTEEFLSFIDEGTLAVEVWGHRRSGFLDVPGVTMGGAEGGDSNEARRQKSFPEKLVHVASILF